MVLAMVVHFLSMNVRITVRLNMKKLYVLSLLLASCLISGCAMFGKNPGAPSRVEQTVFTIKTNYIELPVFVTNTVSQTVRVPLVVTNELGITVWRTNETTQVRYETVWVTNTIPKYQYETADSSKAVVTSIGGAINMVAPGIGTIASSAILGFFAIWGRLRSSKLNNASISLAQNIETIREVVKSLPDGAKYDAAIVTYLKDHQRDTDSYSEVLRILQNNVSNPEAKAAMAEIQSTIATLKT
jgi:hypothetical protein